MKYEILASLPGFVIGMAVIMLGNQSLGFFIIYLGVGVFGFEITRKKQRHTKEKSG